MDMRNTKDHASHCQATIRFLKNNKAFYPSIIACISLLLIGEILSPGFMTMSNVGNILSQSSLLAIIAIGQTFVIISGGYGIDLSIGAAVSLGAMMGPILSEGKDERIIIALLVLAGVGLVIGMINGIGIQLLKIPALAMTLITGILIDGFTLMYTQGKPAMVPKLILTVGKPAWGAIRPIWIIVMIVVFIAEMILRKTKYGNTIFLVGNNRKAAELCGLKVNKTIISAYTISAMISLLSGFLLVGYSGTGQLKMGANYTMLSVAAVVIGGTKISGGKGNLIGTCLGSIVLILLTSILIALNMQAGVRDLFQGIVLVIILVLQCRAPRLRQ